MAELEAQTRKMAQELAEYKSESTELRNQDHTVRRLEERVRTLEAELGEKVDASCILLYSSVFETKMLDGDTWSSNDTSCFRMICSHAYLMRL